MTTFSVCMIAIVGSIIGLFLSEQNKGISVLLGIVGAVILLSFTLDRLGVFLKLLELIEEKTNVNEVYIGTMLKMTGVAIICDMSADLCGQSGNALIAKQVRLFGRVCVLAVGYPFIEELIQMLDSFF